MTIKNEYEVWKKKVTEDADLTAELTDMEGKEDRITDAFYQNLAFGTGGLRGVIGAGTNRMNIYTVGKASQGLADYINRHFPKEERKIAISYDSRIKSSLFAKRAAEVFAANGIRVFIYTELMPTPMLSWAVRSLSCAAGVMVTASHNPSKYNGYKVYGPDGCQITTDAAAEILGCIEKTDAFEDVKREDFETALENGRISYIREDTVTSFIEAVKEPVHADKSEENVDKNISIVYSFKWNRIKADLRILKESSFTNITVVKEQELTRTAIFRPVPILIRRYGRQWLLEWSMQRSAVQTFFWRQIRTVTVWGSRFPTVRANMCFYPEMRQGFFC